jgi:outer membrane protein assembly factor BamD
VHVRTWGRTAAIFAVVIALGAGAAGCAKKGKPKLVYEERPVELLYNVGADRLDRRQWNDAVEYFREVERQHPYSEWSRRAILMTAYAHYQSNNYGEAIADADRFISLYPGNPNTVYAYYLKAICYFEQIVDVGRDQASTELAQNALRDIVKRYPQSEYAADARLKMDMVNDQLAGKEMTIGRYYLRGGDPMGAIGRFRTVIDKYQTTSHSPEALYRLVEAYLTVGLVDEAKKNAAVLGYNYPGDPWYREAYKLMTSRGLRPAATPVSDSPHLPRLLPRFGKHKESTLPPPVPAAPEAAPAEQTASDGSLPTPTETPKPKRKKGNLLGL